MNPPRKPRDPPESDVKSTEIDKGEQIIDLYKEVVSHVCSEGEDKETYGEVTKLDVNNILELNQRIVAIGMEVGEAKLQERSYLAEMDSFEEIRKDLIDEGRELDVMADAVKIAEKYELVNPELMRPFFRKIINLVLDVEAEYIMNVRELE